ncbi:MAG: hypothetical protein AAB466_12190 [Verrucomicrobiota bacterium]
MSVPNSGAGYYSVNRTATNNFKAYKARSNLAHTQISTLSTQSGSAPNQSMAAWGGWYMNVGFIAYPTGKRLSFVAFHDGLTSAESAAFYAAIQKMRNAMGGGFV